MKGVDAYLSFYNLALFCGWSICLFHVLRNIHRPGTVYEHASGACILSQSVSLLETLHASLGLVRSSPVMSLIQWTGRSHVLLLILNAVPSVQQSPFAAILLLVWALSEVIRYPWYACLSLRSNGPPQWLTWLRYTAFIPLYPVGVACEMALIYLALPSLKNDPVYRGRSLSLPNQLNFSFDYPVFCRVLLAVYLFPWWMLYSSLIRMRGKKIGKGKLE